MKKKVKIHCYFIEPASYTIDKIRNVYMNFAISYSFLKSYSASTTNLFEGIYLDRMSFIQRIKYILTVFRTHDFIIINGYNNDVFILNFVLNFFSSSKRFIAIESDTKLRIPSNLLKKMLKKIYLKIVFSNSYVLAFSGGSKTHQDLFRYYGMKKERIFLLPMMIDNAKFYHQKHFPRTFTFLFVGRLLDSKNVSVLCEKFLCNFSNKDAKLVVVGGGDNLIKFQEKYKDPKIEFKGSVFGEELIKIYQEASVFVFPSTWEQWGLVINEALSASLPIIVHAEVGAVQDLIEQRNVGYIIHDWEEMSDRMLELYNHPEMCKIFSQNATELMKQYWNYSLYEQNLSDAIKYVEHDK